MNEVNGMIVSITVDKRLAAFETIFHFVHEFFWWRCTLLTCSRAQSECHCNFINGQRSSCNSHPTEHQFCDLLAVWLNETEYSVVHFV